MNNCLQYIVCIHVLIQLIHMCIIRYSYICNAYNVLTDVTDKVKQISAKVLGIYMLKPLKKFSIESETDSVFCNRLQSMFHFYTYLLEKTNIYCWP